MIPRWLRLLERLLLNRDDREFLAGDLEEDYRRQLRRGRLRAATRHTRALLLASSRRGPDMLARIWSDLRHARRTMARRPAFAVAATLTLAIGVGATTAILSIADAVLLAPLDYPEPERLLFVSSGFPGSTSGGDQLSLFDIRAIAGRSRTLEGIAPYNTGRAMQFRDTGTGNPERVRANVIEPGYLTLLGARVARGRLFTDADNRVPNGHPIVIITHEFWQRRLAGDPQVLGRTLTVSDVALTVVGVLDPSFRDVSAEEGYAFASDVFIPVMMAPAFGDQSYLTERTARNFWALARVRRGISVEQAKSEISAIGEQLQRDAPASNRGFSFWADRLDAYLARDTRGPIVLLFAGSIFVLLIGCANVANLLLAHLSARTRELAVRRALGASRFDILGLLFAESLALAAGGGALGVFLASIGADAFKQLVPGALTPRLASASLSVAVLGFAGLITVGVALLLSALAAIRVSRERAIQALRDAGRGTTAASGRHTRRLLLAGEVAAAVILVIASWLMLDSLSRLRQTDLGFRTERLLTLEMNLGTGRYADADAVHRFGVDLVSRLRATPGVESALLWGPGRPGRNTWVTFPGREGVLPGSERLMAWRHTINPGALRDIGIPIVRGRDFSSRDTGDAPAVAIVSETLARTLWPGEPAVGKRMKWRSDDPASPLLEVVGVAADAKHRGRVSDLLYPARDVYVPHTQRADRMVVAVVRAAADPGSIVPALRAAVRELDAELPLFNISTLAAQLAEEEAETRFAAVLMTAYGCVALLLAAVGVYGVLSSQVAVRRREMAVRMALGAPRADLVWMIVGDGMRPALAGIAIGLAGAAFLTRYLTSVLYRVSPRDPKVFALVATILAVVALVATVLPARRATRVEPLEALRAE